MHLCTALTAVCPALGLAFGLAGCAAGPPAPVLDALIGQPPTALVHALGVPVRTWRGGGMLFMAFDRQVGAVIPGSGPVAEKPFSTPDPLSAGTGLGTPPQLVIRVCETTFEVVSGRAVRWTQRGTGCG